MARAHAVDAAPDRPTSRPVRGRARAGPAAHRSRRGSIGCSVHGVRSRHCQAVWPSPAMLGAPRRRCRRTRALAAVVGTLAGRAARRLGSVDGGRRSQQSDIHCHSDAAGKGWGGRRGEGRWGDGGVGRAELRTRVENCELHAHPNKPM